MPLRSSLLRSTALSTVLACWLGIAGIQAAHAQSEPNEREIAVAIEKLKADPNLAQERKTRTLRWKDTNKPQRSSDSSGFFRWIANFFVWLSQISRVLVWVVGGLLAVALIVAVVRMLRYVDTSGLKKAPVVPTHVRDLDIRPESLPDDIGAAALQLWQRGEHRAALALLYRGLLSRLAHVHEVPIRDSTTEGDCLALAKQHLDPARIDYVAQLIRVWQRATYGGREAQLDEVQQLCEQFASALAGSNTSAVPQGSR